MLIFLLDGGFHNRLRDVLLVSQQRGGISKHFRYVPYQLASNQRLVNILSRRVSTR
jgi:hypothetical protein